MPDAEGSKAWSLKHGAGLSVRLAEPIGCTPASPPPHANNNLNDHGLDRIRTHGQEGFVRTVMPGAW